MRKVILGVAVSLDGYIEGPKGEIDWCFTDQDYGMQAFLDSIDALFIGRKSYELLERMRNTEDPAQGPGLNLDAMEKFVCSTTLKSVASGYSLIAGDVAATVAGIKKSPGKHFWLFGGTSLIKYFLEHNLVDELWLSVHPVLLGGGKSLFEQPGKRMPLTLTDSRAYNTGLVSLTYQIF